LLAQHLTSRPTEDLDFFTAPGRGDIPAARDGLEDAARDRGWRTERIEDSATFCRMIIRSDTGELLTDLAVDSPPGQPRSVTIAGPTFDPEELAGRKMLALFDRRLIEAQRPAGAARWEWHRPVASQMTDLPPTLARWRKRGSRCKQH
jgi:hypothetical protein